MLNGGGSYGARCRTPDGKEELYCILGVWKTDAEGKPVFGAEMLGTVVHEFCHSYTNAIVDRHAAALEAAGKKMFPHVEAAMRRQGYGNWKTMMYESMVRACVIRYTHTHLGAEATRRAIAYQKARKFLWIEELSKLLGEYEARREEYADLDKYFPRVVEFFGQYSDRFVEEQQQLLPQVAAKLNEYGRRLVDQVALAATRPKVVSITRPAERPRWTRSSRRSKWFSTAPWPMVPGPWWAEGRISHKSWASRRTIARGPSGACRSSSSRVGAIASCSTPTDSRPSGAKTASRWRR